MSDPTPRAIRFLRLERTGDAVRKQLAPLDQVRGVQGWMIGTGMGEVMITSMQSTFNVRMLDAIGDHVVRSSIGVAGGDAAGELEINYTQGNVLAHKIGGGWLMVFCEAQTDLAMARMTLSVTAASLSTDRALQNA